MKLNHAIVLIVSALIIGGLGSYVIFGKDKVPETSEAASMETTSADAQDYAGVSIPDLVRMMKMSVPPPAKQAGDFELTTLDGKKARLSSFKGKTVLLNFWTTW